MAKRGGFPGMGMPGNMRNTPWQNVADFQAECLAI